MVDLVKIRKKKAEKKKAEEEAAAAAAESSSGRVDESSSGESAAPIKEPRGEAASPVILSPAEGEGSPDSGESRGEPRNASSQVAPQSGDPSSSQPAQSEVEGRLRMTGDASPADSRTTSKLDRFKAEAGKRRESAAAHEAAAEAERLEALTFLIAGEQYAVDIERIVEIVTPRPVTRIPNSDSSVLGIISLRGTIVTLLDVRQKLGHPAAEAPTADTRIVVIDSGTETVGFTVDRVLRVVKTARGEVEAHPIVHAGETNEAILGVFRAGGSLTILLDLDKLLDHNALAAHQA